jgi:hypothetical protein
MRKSFVESGFCGRGPREAAGRTERRGRGPRAFGRFAMGMVVTPSTGGNRRVGCPVAPENRGIVGLPYACVL